MPELLTTKEVASLLRVKERKVYDLASAGEIPCTRVMGKLLFPRSLIEAWIVRGTEYGGGAESLRQRPDVLAGSHDPLLDWAIRESESGIATFCDGSLDGIERIAAGKAIAAGTHLYEPGEGDWNVGHVRRLLHGQPVVLVEWAKREQGLVVAAGNPRAIGSLGDAVRHRFVPRQRSSGAYVLMQYLLAREGLDVGALAGPTAPARSEADLALAIAEGKGDVGLGVACMARQYRLDFVPLWTERYDLLVWRRAYFDAPLQRLMAFCRSPAFRRRAEEFGGYDIEGHGAIHYNAP